MIRTVNENGTIVERELTIEEKKQMELDKAIVDNEMQLIKQKIIARESALAKLVALGLTPEEIAAL